MKWMDEIGAMSAIRFAGENCVTARMDRINFTQPIPVGEVALIRSYVYAAGETSMRVRLNTFHENPRTREAQPTTESYAVYVAINEDREPTSVPDLTVASEQGHELREQALNDENGT